MRPRALTAMPACFATPGRESDLPHGRGTGRAITRERHKEA